MRIKELYQLLTESLLLESYNQLKDIFDINNIHLPYRREFETLSAKNGFNNMTVPEVFEYLVKKEPHIFRREGVSENEFRKVINVQFWVSQFIKDPSFTSSSFVIMINARLEDRLKRVAQKSQENDYEVLIKTTEYVLYKPNSEAASCKLGKGTKWCTAATQGDNHFNNYSNKGDLYYIHTRLPHPFDKIAIFVYNPHTYEIFNSQDDPISKREVIANLGFEHVVDIFSKIGLEVEDDTVTYTAYTSELVSREQFLNAVEDDADSALESDNISEYMSTFTYMIVHNGVMLLTDVIATIEHELSGDNTYKQFFRNNNHYESSFIAIERKIKTSGVTEVSPDEDILRALVDIRKDVIGLFSERYIREVEAIFELVERMKRQSAPHTHMSDLYDDVFAWGDHALRLIDSVAVGPTTLEKSNVLSFIYNYDFQAKLDMENAYRELS